MLYREIIAVCSEIHTKHINTLCGQNVEFVNVKPGGTPLGCIGFSVSTRPLVHVWVYTFIIMKLPTQINLDIAELPTRNASCNKLYNFVIGSQPRMSVTTADTGGDASVKQFSAHSQLNVIKNSAIGFVIYLQAATTKMLNGFLTKAYYLGLFPRG
jgi:hypothetical protein